MKKSLLLACLAFAFTASAQGLSMRQAPADPRDGETSLEYCYCGSMGIAPDKLKAGVSASGAMYIPAEEAAKLKGNTVSAVSVFTGYDETSYTNSIPEATVWITYDLYETPFTSTTGRLSDQMTSYNSIPLENPYVIEGDKGFYVGYTVVSIGEQQSPIVFDNNSHDNDWGGWYRIGDNSWENQTSQYGFVLIKATLKGESLPRNAVGVFNSTCWGFAYPGQTVENDLQLINMGAEPVKSVKIEMQCGGSAPVSGTMAVEGDIFYNDLFRLYVDAVVNQKGCNVPMKFTVTEVNGKPNEYADNSVTNYVLCLADGEGFSRNVVMEQGTSLSQGGAPLGIVTNRLMAKTYGTTRNFIPVMVHLYDELSCADYDPFFTTYLCTSIPSVIPNRMRQYRNTRAGFDEVEFVFEKVYSMPAFANMKVEVNQDEADPAVLNITARTSFLDDCEGDWRLAYVLRRDNVGPAEQANFYSKDYTLLPGEEPFGEMGGFEEDPDPCDILHDNVAVIIEDYNGVPGSVPSSVRGGEIYEYKYSLHADDENKLKDSTVIVYLINALNGTIEQAVAVPFAEFNGASVRGVSESPAVEVSGLDGAIRVAGDFRHASIYSVAGVQVASIISSSTVSVAPGLYIVDVDGSAQKIIVR